MRPLLKRSTVRCSGCREMTSDERVGELKRMRRLRHYVEDMELRQAEKQKRVWSNWFRGVERRPKRWPSLITGRHKVDRS
jgi:hypothetical protein